MTTIQRKITDIREKPRHFRAAAYSVIRPDELVISLSSTPSAIAYVPYAVVGKMVLRKTNGRVDVSLQDQCHRLCI